VYNPTFKPVNFSIVLVFVCGRNPRLSFNYPLDHTCSLGLSNILWVWISEIGRMDKYG
jgi:hypothetical protein